MENCIFCKIVKGEINSAKVYEDSDTLAFLDTSPFSKGHTLVIPKKHFEDIYQIDASTLEKVIVASKHVAEKIKYALQASGMRISQSNGALAGQAVFHIHFHIIPRYQNDGLQFDEVGNRRASRVGDADLQRVLQEINQ